MSFPVLASFPFRTLWLVFTLLSLTTSHFFFASGPLLVQLLSPFSRRASWDWINYNAYESICQQFLGKNLENTERWEKETLIISFLSDYGYEDGWIASCKGVILTIAPKARFLDISHGISSFNVRKGALVLASTLPYLPKGIHVAIIDPGVGTARRGIIMQVKRGDFLVGPDNGIFGPVIERLGGAKEGVEITNKKYMSKEICATFHGRDIFSPVAAHLFLGVKMGEFGQKIKPREMQQSPWKKPKIANDQVIGEIIDIDKFGTLRSNISPEIIEKIGLEKTNQILSEWSNNTFDAPFVDTFGEVEEGKKLLLVDSTGLLSLAINCGNAAEELNCDMGDRVIIYKHHLIY